MRKISSVCSVYYCCNVTAVAGRFAGFRLPEEWALMYFGTVRGKTVTMGKQGQIIDGKLASVELLERLALVVNELRQEYGVVPSLVVIIVGDDPASKLYVGNKQRRAEELGLYSRTIALPADTTQDELLGIIDRLNDDRSVHGILVQLPLPRHIDKIPVINAVSPEKDVDGFHNANAGKLLTGQMDCMIPCTPQGCIHLIKKVCPNLAGRRAVVLGRSNIVGKPVALLLLHENCTVSILHSGTSNVAEYCIGADIIIAAIGKAAYVKAEWIKPGAIVIDVGINLVNREGKNRFVGDVDFDNVLPIASAITPVPGGVGPMTIAYLLVNTVLGACQQCGINRCAEIKSSLLQ